MSEPPEYKVPETNSSYGKFVVIGIFVVAALGAVSGLLYKANASRQPLAFWGAEGIRLLQTAKTVELMTLEPVDSDDEPTADKNVLHYGGQKLRITGSKDVSQAQGLIHHRHFLIENVSFDWDSVRAATEQNWAHALRFREGDKEIIVLFNLHRQLLANLEREREITMIPRISDNWKSFISRQTNQKP